MTHIANPLAYILHLTHKEYAMCVIAMCVLRSIWQRDSQCASYEAYSFYMMTHIAYKRDL